MKPGVATVVAVGLLLCNCPETRAQTPPANNLESGPKCTTRYAGNVARAQTTAKANEAGTRYVHCVRSTATYQCLSYGTDGRMRARKHTVSQHGTAFIFRHERQGALLLTNEHVTEWPFVTSSSAEVEDVPEGCKRVAQSLHIVDNEEDTFGRDDIPLTRVVVDPELDAAIVRGKLPEAPIPFELGNSAALTTGAAVQVRGFPLGAFQALTVGKVINPAHHDTEEGWDHTDFVIDAPLSSGSSGSPVLAVHCATGRYELVGLFHAAYKEGQSLNVVVGIDEVREMMRTLKPRPRHDRELPMRPRDRRKILGVLAKLGRLTMPYGGRTAQVAREGDVLRWTIYRKSFPLLDAAALRLDDGQATRTFGQLRRVWVPSEGKPVGYVPDALPRNDRRLFATILVDLQRQSLRVLRYRQLHRQAKASRVAHARFAKLQARMTRAQAQHRVRMRGVAAFVRQRQPTNRRTRSSLADELPQDYLVPSSPTASAHPARRPEPPQR